MLRACVLLLGLLMAQLVSAAEASTAPTILTITGQVKSTETFSLTELDKLPQKKMTVQIPWYPEPQTFEGPLLRDVLKLAGAKGKLMKLQALNDYVIEVPMGDAEKYDVIIASRLNGKTMSVREKGPLFVMYPFDRHEELRKTDYFRRCAWQLKQITLE
ncbi:molybdopterin-dependent oxidoreductase [Chitinibacter fontanus]|uniref:Molybdopterin-dependent oxidoreductase n=1 Tax=Chitinibacter fontanus TaxID=1737446 RepID=A0A7D5Z7N3_9NEIS|nr:molybdopterin-dependent oxidoreductase [Chitinibacter fontanus]QLI81782.1 molybdopterin-dependent oxidoreductase [Chitinibacter fontanus]